MSFASKKSVAWQISPVRADLRYREILDGDGPTRRIVVAEPVTTKDQTLSADGDRFVGPLPTFRCFGQHAGREFLLEGSRVAQTLTTIVVSTIRG